MSLLPLPFPAKTISLDYGATTFPYSATDPHNGTDFSSRSNGVVAGTLILASAEGVVRRSRFETDTDWPTMSKPNRNAGNSIDVDYPDLDVRVRYMHRPVGSVSPRVGDEVVLGSVLGVIGATGLVTAAHLHMEAWDRKTGRRVSPWRFFSRTLTVADALTQPAGGNSKPITPVPAVPEKEIPIIMATGVIYTNDTDDETRKGAIVDTESGLFSKFGWFPIAYADGLAVGFGATKAAGVTSGQYNAIAKDQAALRALRYGKS